MCLYIELAERFEDMCIFLREAVILKADLTIEERNMLSIAYKNVTGALRAAAHVMLKDKYDDPFASNKKQYQTHVLTQLANICSEAIFLMENHLLAHAYDPADKVFYLKQAGDYHRYLAEIQWGHDHAESARVSYETAFQLARVHLAPANVIRLGVALNYSVWAFDICKRTDLAMSIARTSVHCHPIDPVHGH